MQLGHSSQASGQAVRPPQASPNAGRGADSANARQNAPSRNNRPAPPSRGRREFGRLARVPEMFGDFFGAGLSQISLPAAIRPGVLNGASGTARFLGASSSPNGPPNDFNYEHPGIGNTVVINVPGFVNISVPNGVPFDVDVVGPQPPPTLAFTLDAATLATINNLTNAPQVVAQYFPLIEAAETSADPEAVVVSTQVQVASEAQVESAVDDFDLVFPFVLATQVSSPLVINVPSPGTGGSVVGRQKIAENSSPLPRDRVFVNYSYFNNVPIAEGGVNIDRVVPGFEKTFFDGIFSFEGRFPFASTLDYDIIAGGQTNTNEVVAGNITMNLKTLLYANANGAYAAGLGIVLPTADDVAVLLQDGTKLVIIDNESVHLMPFAGFLQQAANSRGFVQGFLQFDFDTNGNPVRVNTNGIAPTGVGRINDTSFLFADVGVGYWLYQDDSPGSIVTAVIPTLELHYNRSLQSTDVVTGGAFQVGHFADQIELLNLVVGTSIQLGPTKSIGLAYATPIGGGMDQQFDGEFRAMVNLYPARN